MAGGRNSDVREKCLILHMLLFELLEAYSELNSLSFYNNTVCVEEHEQLTCKIKHLEELVADTHGAILRRVRVYVADSFLVTNTTDYPASDVCLFDIVERHGVENAEDRSHLMLALEQAGCTLSQQVDDGCTAVEERSHGDVSSNRVASPWVRCSRSRMQCTEG